MDKRAKLADAREERKIYREQANKLIGKVRGEGRSLDPTEMQMFDNAEARINALNDEIEKLDDGIRADEAAAAVYRQYAPTRNTGEHMTETRTKPTMPGSTVRVTSEPATYNRADPKVSFFRDLFQARTNNDRDSLERLARNNKEADVRAQANRETRAISTSNGAGGEFVPPAWLELEYVKLARPRRVFADLVRNDPLPAGTDQINIPKVNSGTATAVQGTQNSAVQQTDMVTGSIASSVVTVAGAQSLSLQLLEQSPLNIDDVILSDLTADYSAQLDKLCLYGPGTGGQPTGVLTLSGTNSVTFTGTSLTGANSLYNALASAISKIYTGRFEAPDAIVMHPRRFMWAVSQQDSQGRPVIVPVESGPNNALGVLGPQLNAEGPVGRMLGLDVYLDANMPTNLGTGTNEDRVIVCKSDDIRLWESNIRAEAFQQTYAANLSVLVRLYNYMSFQPARYPASISVISGSGLSLVL